jgi:FdhD protein
MLEGDSVRVRPDRVVTEEPLEIRLHGPGEAPRAVAVTMRTPGHDFELAIGFCVSEGLLRDPDDVASVEYCVGPDGQQEYNVVTIARRTVVGNELSPRAYPASAACGVCGKATLDDLAVRCAPVGDGPRFAWSTLQGLPSQFATSQKVFDATGGLHAGALFDVHGEIQLTREDVGRHNALDKLIGHRFVAGSLPVAECGLLLSGRIGFELVQKAAVAGIPLIVAVGAPSSLAIETAREFGITVVGFLRGDRANVYTNPERVTT